jgi:hypothetical protein
MWYPQQPQQYLPIVGIQPVCMEGRKEGEKAGRLRIHWDSHFKIVLPSKQIFLLCVRTYTFLKVSLLWKHRKSSNQFSFIKPLLLFFTLARIYSQWRKEVF